MITKPEGFSTLTPVRVSKDAQATIEDYKKALGAEISCEAMICPKTGKIAHVGLKIGDATLLLSDEFPEMDMPATGLQQFYLYVENADNAFNQAKSAGWEVLSEIEDMFWGDRTGALKDKSGNTWKLAQKIRDVSPEEMEEVKKKMAEAA
jgi:PhnB protein